MIDVSFAERLYSFMVMGLKEKKYTLMRLWIWHIKIREGLKFGKRALTDIERIKS